MEGRLEPFYTGDVNNLIILNLNLITIIKLLKIDRRLRKLIYNNIYKLIIGSQIEEIFYFVGWLNNLNEMMLIKKTIEIVESNIPNLPRFSLDHLGNIIFDYPKL